MSGFRSSTRKRIAPVKYGFEEEKRYIRIFNLPSGI